MTRWYDYPLTSGFKEAFWLDSGGYNKGHDYGTPEGTPIDALVGGRVVSAGDDGDGWGLSVKVQDAQGYIHNYGHLSTIGVRPGQAVEPGTLLGASGNTGKSTGPHLSYDVWDPEGNYIDPARFIAPAREAGGGPMVDENKSGIKPDTSGGGDEEKKPLPGKPGFFYDSQGRIYYQHRPYVDPSGNPLPLPADIEKARDDAMKRDLLEEQRRQFDRTFGQRDRQFAMDYGLRSAQLGLDAQQLAQRAYEFEQEYGLKREDFYAGISQFNAKLGEDARQFDEGLAYKREEGEAERTARRGEAEAGRRFGREEREAAERFRRGEGAEERGFTGRENALARAQRAQEFAAQRDLEERQFAAAEEEKRVQRGLQGARQFAELASSVDPLALPAFYEAGGGNIMNAIASGGTALSDRGQLGAARTLRALEGSAAPNPSQGLTGANMIEQEQVAPYSNLSPEERAAIQNRINATWAGQVGEAARGNPNTVRTAGSDVDALKQAGFTTYDDLASQFGVGGNAVSATRGNGGVSLAPAAGSPGAVSGFAGATLDPDVLDPNKPQRGNFGPPVVAAAAGLTGTVTRPTLILAGENGPEDINIDPLDRPYVDRVRAMRERSRFPSLNIYDVGFFNTDPVMRANYLQGLQGKYGVPAESTLAQAQRYRLQGLSGRPAIQGY